MQRRHLGVQFSKHHRLAGVFPGAIDQTKPPGWSWHLGIMWFVSSPTPEDLILAARCVRDCLGPAQDRDWSVPAGDLEWQCWRVLDHMAQALSFYASHLATRAPTRLAAVRIGAQDRPLASPGEILEAIGSWAAILAAVARSAPPDSRGFHSQGMADASGFLAMGCDELLIHTSDIGLGLDLDFVPPSGLAARVRDRLFPWAPPDVDPWDGLRWANGRLALQEHQRLGPKWSWWCAPLAEWDGVPRSWSPR